MNTLNIVKANDAWILHREEIDTIQDGNCNVYVLIDAYTAFCFGQILSIDLPSKSDIIDLLKNSKIKASRWPKRILIAKNDPYVETLKTISEELRIEVTDLPYKDLRYFVKPFSDSFEEFKRGKHNHIEPLSQTDEKEVRTFIPETYGPCPCASGKKYKFCCQKCFKEIVFAMCAAEDGNLDEALHFMREAESKIGLTAEILCRYSICWSFFDQEKSHEYLTRAIQENPNHPRTNYILGIEAMSNKKYSEAIMYYQKAIEYYPKEDKYHLNETYNNLGTVYFELGRYQDAKDAWEKALVFFPTDKMVKNNLIEFIYENPMIPEDIREVSPFINKYLIKNDGQY